MMLVLALGAAVGLVMGLSGAGGGILAVPLLVFALQMTVAQAGPIGLLAVGIAAAAGALLGLKAGIVRYRAALLIAASGIVLAPAGVWLAQRLDTRILGILFAVILLWVAYSNARDSRQGAAEREQGAAPPCIRDTDDGRFVWTSRCAALLAAAGALAGLLSGLLGVGGGFVMVPALQRYTDLDMRATVATSLAVIALIAAAGVATSLSSGQFDLSIGLPFGAGAVAGMLAGSAFSSRLPPRYLKRFFALVCLLVAIGMVAKSV